MNLLALSLLVASRVVAPVEPRPQEMKLITTPAPIETIVEQVTAAPRGLPGRERKLVELFHQAGATDADVTVTPMPDTVKPHLEAAAKRVEADLKASGATAADVQSALAGLAKRHAKLGNTIVATIPGRTDHVLAFGAHVDSAEGSPGVVDNWSGCVLLANLYQALHGSRPQHTLWFVGFADEELGSLGAHAWADALDQKQIWKIDGFVTVECAGVSSPAVWWSGSNPGVVELAAESAKRVQVPLSVLDFKGTSSDSIVVRQKGIPSLSIFGVEPARMGILHGPEDRAEAIDPKKLAETYKLLVALAVDFDPHPRALRWDYVKEKLKIDDPTTGRAPIKPVVVDLAKASAPPASPPPDAPAKRNPPDGSHRP
jgi:hypothetical protein